MIKEKIYSSSLLFLTIVAFNMVDRYGLRNNWTENLDEILISIFLISGFFLWRFLLKNMIWKNKLVAVLNYLLITILAFIANHILWQLIFGSSITYIFSDNVGQMVFLFTLCVYSFALIVSFGLAVLSLKLMPTNSIK
jgi:hypothetical protein